MPHQMTLPGFTLMLLTLTVFASCRDLENRMPPTPVATLLAVASPTPTSIPTVLATATDQPSSTASVATATATPTTATVLPTLPRPVQRMLTALPPQPTPLSTAPPNEAGIMPGVTTDAQVVELLGPPVEKIPTNPVSWRWNDPKIPNLGRVYFMGGIVQAIDFWDYRHPATAEAVIQQYGPPELVVLVPGTDYRALPPGPPPTPPTGYLLYLSRGLEFNFRCDGGFPACDGVRSCTGVPRDVPVPYKIYFVPISITEWFRHRDPFPDNTCVKPWPGFE